MTRAHYFVALAVSITVAFVLLLIAAWVSGGSYPHTGGKAALWVTAFVLPMVIATNAGLGHSLGLLITFATYLVVVFTLLVVYVARQMPVSRNGPNL